MQINIENLVSISEANQNFSKVARLVDREGAAVILKNNAPRYVLIDYAELCKGNVGADESVMNAASRILNEHMHAFEELARN